MAQTTGGTSFRNVVLEYSTDNSTWTTDLSGVANKIKVGQKKRATGSANTGSGDDPIVTVGKKKPFELEVSIVYSEVTTEAFTVLDTAFEAATPIYLRYAPKGTATGNYRYTTDKGYIEELDMPGGDVEKGDPLICSFKLVTPKITRAVI